VFAHRPVAPLQVGTTAVLIAWRAARYRVILVAGLNLLGGAVPVTTAWLGKLLLNEVALGQAADLRRSAALAVASGIMASVTIALLQAASYVHSSVPGTPNITAAVRQPFLGTGHDHRGLRERLLGRSRSWRSRPQKACITRPGASRRHALRRRAL